ncbi:ABC-2 type transport system ATP-binding protein [Sphingobacterium alimentarium]|uniref:ABC-2 type transport system ATP-binding protein n=1 Tax=Sphingobacterium alimentarium TaxID=797292 RepID=A0A4R3W2E4_9SPHI|nr:ABC transporter ATP-binding protein [Sphingobacterium alimentarium]TCV20019.1 ABC-2 type transport system ATP-binding protein [Sphingobacterium alimentarium]
MISIKNLNFSYTKSKPIFADLNLELEAGHIYGLLGKNGAGKSTLLKNMVGLIYPTNGHITVIGEESRRRNPSLLKEVCFIPEDLHLPHISVNQFLKSTAPFYPNFDEAYFQSLFEEFAIPENQNLGNMSYGQKKKFLISFGLATNTKVVVMDEPTNGLDIPSKAQFRKVLASVMNEDRVIVISTHQVRDLDNLIDSVIILDQHKIVLNESIQRISDRLHFKKVTALSDDVLYAEKSIGAYHVISSNPDFEDSKIDLELLFNAATAENENITKHFRTV